MMDYENNNTNHESETSGGLFSGYTSQSNENTNQTNTNTDSYNTNTANATGNNTQANNDVSQRTSYERYDYSGNRYPNDYSAYEQSKNTGSYQHQQMPKKPKKSGNGFLKKAVAIVALGIFFGLSAGVSFYFVNLATGANKVTQQIESDTTKDQPEKTETTTNDSQASGEAMIKNGKSDIDTTNAVTSAVVTDVTEVVDEVMPSVVSITNTYTATQSFFGQDFSQEAQASGSGIIIGENDSELLIATNNHVVAGSDALKVQFIDNEIADAQIKGTDSNMDLAVIAVKLDDIKESTKSAISIAKMGDSDALKVGEPAIAIGNALGYGQSVTTGVISALDRQIEMSEDGSTSGKLIQTDAAINPGNSGGALLNVKGEVIGINSSKIGGSTVEGMGYAIPISSAKPIIEELMTKEIKNKVDVAKKGFLGIAGINVTSDVAKMYNMPEGVYVNTVYDGTAAQKAGILKGDIITEFDGSSVGSMEDLQGYLEYYAAGTTVKVTVQRVMVGGEYEPITIEVTLGTQSQFPNNQ